MVVPMRAALRGLNLTALAALRLSSPRRSFAIVRFLARRLTPLGDTAKARRAIEDLRLAGRGTCLSRAVAVAACLPGSEVVIGVDPWAGWIPSAHAWVEHCGQRLDEPASSGEFVELARLSVWDARRDSFGYDDVASKIGRSHETCA